MQSMSKMKFKIRPTILFLLVFIVSSVVVVTLSLQYYFSKELAFNATLDNFKHIYEKIEQRVGNLDKNNKKIISLFELYENINYVPKTKQRHPLLPLFTNVLSNNTFIYALYVGHENDDFYEVISLDSNSSLRKKYKVSNDIKWLVVKVYKENNTRYQYEEFLDKNLKQILTRKTKSTYFPTSRPWYKKAKMQNSIIKTSPYIYANLEAFGVTYAKKMKDKTILGLDVSRKSMATFLQKQIKDKKTKIFLYNEKGDITASVNYKKFLNDKNKQELPKDIKEKILKKDTNNGVITLNNKEHLLNHTLLKSTFNTNEQLAMIVPVNFIMEPYTKKIFISFFITVLILTFTIPLVWYSTKMIIKPIQQLSLENNLIMNRKFDDVKKVDTNIKEIYELSTSLVEMAKAIKKYELKQRELMDSFIKLIASAIDAKSKYTGGHCERVPILTQMIVNEVSLCNKGKLKEFKIKNKEEEREISIAAWLHDCGKVTTPEYVVDKAVKLETIYNRIHEIRTRFEVIYRDEIIKEYEKLLSKNNIDFEKNKLEEKLKILQEEFEIIASTNAGSEFLDDTNIKKIEEISKRTWEKYFDNTIGLSKDEYSRLENKNFKIKEKEYLLANKKEHIIKREKDIFKEYEKYNFSIKIPENLYNFGEIYNLCIKKGTLTNEERFKINEHVMMSIIMLEQLPFPKSLKNVPNFAGAHHETLVGTGYPRGIKDEDMSIPAKVIAIADIFEALTANDRPYKDAKKLSEAIRILSFMAKDKHIDEEIFKLFLSSKVYEKYAKNYLDKEQIDEVDISKYI